MLILDQFWAQFFSNFVIRSPLNPPPEDFETFFSILNSEFVFCLKFPLKWHITHVYFKIFDLRAKFGQIWPILAHVWPNFRAKGQISWCGHWIPSKSKPFGQNLGDRVILRKQKVSKTRPKIHDFQFWSNLTP